MINFFVKIRFLRNRTGWLMMLPRSTAFNLSFFFLFISGLALIAGFSACSTVTAPERRSGGGGAHALPPSVKSTPPVETSGESESLRFAALDDAAEQEIAAGHVTGAVIVAGYKDRIVYRKAFGHKTLKPKPKKMTVDTMFDVASMTKVVATTTAVMQLAEKGRLNVDMPVAAYWPAFAKNGKAGITLRQLLTHTSGLRAEVNSKVKWNGYQGAIKAIAQDRPVSVPGQAFRYSDANFIALGEIVRRVSGLPLDEYCARHIFEPAGMKQTTFKPDAALRGNIAPSDLRWGDVQDPTAYRMGGVAGHAGLFSTADDLAVFARMLLDNGLINGQRILSGDSVAALHRPQRIPGSSTRRGLGWDMLSPYSQDHTNSFPFGSFGHTGYTGTSIWIEPKSGTYLIILTSRLYPNGKGNARPLRAKAAAAMAAALDMGPPAQVASKAGREPVTPGAGQAVGITPVKTGIDVLEQSGFAPLAGKHIGVISNHSGVDASGDSTIALLNKAPHVHLRAIFSPEHGLSGKLDRKIPSGRDAATGLPIYSLYGELKKPSVEMLRGLDALVYDIQDVGARFYTYITTMAYAMEAAAEAGIAFYVLDRPNPINATIVQGPVSDTDSKSFIAYFPLPLRYGMTAGELACLFNTENHIGARLQVIRMQGYRRDQWFDQTGLPWIDPSPNIRSLDQAILYPGVGSVESANLSVGRGTDTPFEVIGAPWIAGKKLANYLNRREIPGVAFNAESFMPKAAPYKAKRCEGVRLRLTDRNRFDAPRLGLELSAALYRLYPGTFAVDRTKNMFGSAAVVEGIKQGKDPKDIQRDWLAKLDDFSALRSKHLLY